jgi:hypothetical protein
VRRDRREGPVNYLAPIDTLGDRIRRMLDTDGKWCIVRWTANKGFFCGPIGYGSTLTFLGFPDGTISTDLPLFESEAVAQRFLADHAPSHAGVDEPCPMARLHFFTTAYDSWSDGGVRTVYDGGRYQEARAAYFMCKGLLGEHPRYKVRIECRRLDSPEKTVPSVPAITAS